MVFSVLLIGLIQPVASDQASSAPPPVVLAPFYTKSEFTAPVAGSYELPAFGNAADGIVLDTRGQEQRLLDQFGDDKVILLSFIYSTCNDVNGCPLATAVMYSVQTKNTGQPGTA